MNNLQFIIERVQLIVKEKKTNINRACIESGIGKDFIANMKKGQVPSVEKFSDLADYLNVSVDYLIGRTDNPEVNK